jgi:hypothetical protein
MKQISTVAYLFVDSRYYVGPAVDVVFSETKKLSFRSPAAKLKERIAQELDDYTFENPLTQAELDNISLPQRSMVFKRIIILEVKIYVEADVVVRMSLEEENINGS